MNSRYFSRIYFSRYFYSSFKCTLKARIKITRNEDQYFYSDPYYLNKALRHSFKSTTAPKSTAPFRSYFFPINFTFDGSSNVYDLAWQMFISNPNWKNKFFSLFLKLKIFYFFRFNFMKVYFNFFFKSFKLNGNLFSIV